MDPECGKSGRKRKRRWGLGCAEIQALITYDADWLDVRPEAEVAAGLAVEAAEIARMRLCRGYWGAVRERRNELFRIRDMKTVWNVLLEKARRGDAKVCERLLAETCAEAAEAGRFPENAAAGIGGVKVLIIDHLAAQQLSDGKSGGNGEKPVSGAPDES